MEIRLAKMNAKDTRIADTQVKLAAVLAGENDIERASALYDDALKLRETLVAEGSKFCSADDVQAVKDAIDKFKGSNGPN